MRTRHTAAPGFGLTLGYTLAYLGLMVLVPMGVLIWSASGRDWGEMWGAATTRRAWSAYGLTFGASFCAASINAVFGSIVAWVLVRYEFPGRRWADALVDVPFAMPTAVAGLTLANVFGAQGWIGKGLAKLGVEAVFNRTGVVIALVFVTLPFAVRTVQPVMAGLEREVEEAAATLGASRWRAWLKVVFPVLLPAVLTGFALSFARGIGEYGSVVFISSNLPGKTEIAPLLIVSFLEEHDTSSAMAVALVLLVASFVLLGAINYLERRASRFQGAT